MSIKTVTKQFQSPGSAYRGCLFWALNGELEEQELRRQIRLMKKMGLGGFFLHSRVGLKTPYLSDQWFDCMRACVDEAEKQGLKAWLYDEDRWPSGSAGGMVTKNPDYRLRMLHLSLTRKPADITWGKETLAVFIAQIRSHKATKVHRIQHGAKIPALKRKEQLLVFEVRVSEPSSWFNNQTYLDTMNPEAVQAFIKTTHDAYAEQFGDQFGGVIPGIFTDEPENGKSMSTGPWTAENNWRLAWTDRLPEHFRTQYGYDLLEHLPALFYDMDDPAAMQARYHYHDCAADMFSRAFAKQIGEWCETHGLLFTGHLCSEETPVSQIVMNGDAMRFYQYMQMPGIDILTYAFREYDTPRQVASVARQFGRTWRLSETYGATGWDTSFKAQKSNSDWQAAQGINFRCQHLGFYTMEGEAKRDYPASIHFQSPWWDAYPAVEDYFARLNLVLSQGREIRDILCIHAIESAWMTCRLDWLKDGEARDAERRFIDLRDQLIAANLDFDYGDESILAEHGRVQKRQGEPRFIVNKAEYKVVIVPPLLTIRSSTLSLLQKFHKAGGLVIFTGDTTPLLDGLPSDAPAETAVACTQLPHQSPQLVKRLEATARRISITNERGRELAPVLHVLREDRDAFYLFICNTGSRPAKKDEWVLIDVPYNKRTAAFNEVYVTGPDTSGEPVELDLRSGKLLACDATRAGQAWRIQTSLPALGSRLFVFPRKKGLLPRAEKKPETLRKRTLPARPWSYRLTEDNVLVLDKPRFRLANGAWRRAKDILHIDHVIRDALAIEHRGHDMCQPWAQQHSSGELKSTPVKLAYSFDIKKLPDGPVHLGLEHPEIMTITLNGQQLSTDTGAGWWVDPSLRRIPVPAPALNTGRNTLHLELEYDEQFSGLEIVYLLGAFGVSVHAGQPQLTTLPATLKTGNWVTRGLPFYSGAVVYEKTVTLSRDKNERLFLELPGFEGTAARIWADGKEQGIIAWEPQEIELDVPPGRQRVRLGVEIISHRRNSHGPLHFNKPAPVWIGSDEFMTQGEQWTDDYMLVACGLTKAPVMSTRR